ncbi:MAG: VWA domain-containing protein [Sphaerochaeta sp.]|nr:VWA domain-containing protein [Sphaerochaeta sp.]
MANKESELVFILDKSGSMTGLENDTIGGFNSLLKKQNSEEGVARVTTVLFDHRYTLLHDRLPLNEVELLTAQEYEPEGTTALLDAVGRTIDSILENLSGTPKESYPSVLVVIITDGEENASKDYSLQRIRKRIEFCKESQGWEFLFLGANIDAFAAAEEIGISRARSATFHADPTGVGVNFEALSIAMSQLRSSSVVEENWKDEIEGDFKKRGKQRKIT